MKTKFFLKYSLLIILFLLLTGCQLSAVTPTVKVETIPPPTQRVNTAVPTLIPSSVPTFTALPVIKPTVTATTVIPTLTPLPLPSTWIAFLAPDEFGNPFYLKLIKPDGTGLQAVALDNANPEQYTSSCWPQPEFSPDGRYLAVSRSSGVTSPLELIVIDTTSRKVIALVKDFGYSFSWSPDSKQLLHTRPLVQNPIDLSFEPDQGLWVLDIPSGQDHQLIPTIPDYVVYEVNWAPDGQRIAMHQAFYEGYGRFGIINADGSGFKKWDAAQIGSFDWSPDGKKIVYDEVTYSPNPPSKLWIMNADGTQPTILFSQDKMAASNPVWSPDGKWITFRDAADPSGQGFSNLWLVGADGQNAHPLTLFEMNKVAWGSWAVDSAHMVVNNDQKVYLVALDGSTPVFLAEGGCPVWQP
jgi:dipeptidyl aminopeptidase/acylaminoacyl peptidase